MRAESQGGRAAFAQTCPGCRGRRRSSGPSARASLGRRRPTAPAGRGDDRHAEGIHRAAQGQAGSSPSRPRRQRCGCREPPLLARPPHSPAGGGRRAEEERVQRALRGRRCREGIPGSWRCQGLRRPSSRHWPGCGRPASGAGRCSGGACGARGGPPGACESPRSSGQKSRSRALHHRRGGKRSHSNDHAARRDPAAAAAAAAAGSTAARGPRQDTGTRKDRAESCGSRTRSRDACARDRRGPIRNQLLRA
mmetsp:Transcript_107208/g.320626  ORF Transcript_107208/g.320626 Transcript_107208/m.320626 type:complete len:251 (-) Transcript_107208:728-1480(-)